MKRLSFIRSIVTVSFGEPDATDNFSGPGKAIGPTCVSVSCQ